MDLARIFDAIPLWGLFLITVFVSFLAFEGGLRVGYFLRRKKQGEANAPLEALSGAILGLLAFIMAFTFSMAATRFDLRRELVMEEANAIGTTYLRASYLVEPYKSNVHALLRDYTTARLETVYTQKYQEGLAQANAYHKQLWDQVLQVVEKGYVSPPISLFIDSMNHVIDTHGKRALFVYGLRIPGVLWLVLFSIMVLSMGILGYFSSFRGTPVRGINFAVIVAFALVIYLITELDHPQQGFLRVTQQPLVDVLNMMKTS
jgi:hypothetical protein